MILETIASELQQLYRIDPMPSIYDFLLSDEQYAAYCASHPTIDVDSQETLLIENVDGITNLGLYIAPDIISILMTHNPRRQLHRDNLEATCVAIEGISHLLCTWWKMHRELPCSLLEMELQAEIDKYLICSKWLRQQGKSARGLLSRLFVHYTLHGGMDASQSTRYHRASHLARRFCHAMEHRFLRHHRIPAMVDRARQFYRLSHWQKLRQLA